MKKLVSKLAVVLLAVFGLMTLTGCATSGPKDYMGQEDYVLAPQTEVIKGVEPKDGQLVSVLSVVCNHMTEQRENMITWQYLWSNPDTKPQGLQALIVKGPLYKGLTNDGFVPGVYLIEPIDGEARGTKTKRFTQMEIKSK